IASDQSIDSYGEVVLAKGWRFDRFEKNAPFVDSHNYGSVERLLGKVIDWKIRKGQLIERVQYSIDDPNHTLAQIAWKLTVNGFLKAVSVGFIPTKWVSKWGEGEGYLKELDRLGYDTEDNIRVIYQEQQQIELSNCIIGANGNAVAKAYKADALSDEDLDNLSRKCEQLTRRRSPLPGDGAPPTKKSQATQLDAFVRELNQIINK
ncbi:MAG: hypothetical protein AAF449_21585, partial [Myxococcota bacterium]